MGCILEVAAINVPDGRPAPFELQKPRHPGHVKKMHLTVKLATRKSGRLARAALACLGVALAVSAAAQHEAIEACRDTPTEAARIACLERALAGGNGDPAGRPDDGTEPPPASEDDGRGGAPKAAADAPAEGRGDDAAHAGRLADDAAKPAEAIGASQVRARQRGEDDLESAAGMQVAEYSRVPYRRLQVTLANGQVWRQIEGDTQRFRVDLRRNRTVDINESRLGGYQLRLNEMGRTIRVERIR